MGAALGSAVLGIYSVGSLIAMILTREVTAPLALTLFPAFSRVGEDRAQLVAAYRAAQGVLVAAALPIGVGTAIAAESLVRVVMGDHWLGAVPIIQVLAPVFALQSLSSLVQPLAMARGATRLLFVRDLQAFALRVPLVAAGLLLFGLPGAVATRVITGLVVILLDMSVVRRTIGLRLGDQVARSWRSMLAAIVMGAVLLALDRAIGPVSGVPAHGARLAGLSLVGALTYLATHALLWIAAGRPDGPEQEAGRVWHGLGRRLALRRQRAP